MVDICKYDCLQLIKISLSLPLTCESVVPSTLHGSLSFHRSIHQSFPKIPSMVGEADTEDENTGKHTIKYKGNARDVRLKLQC